MLDTLFFHGWEPIVRTVIAAVCVYVMLVAMLRIAGQRTLAKWYAFDLVVTTALGSTFANGVLSKEVSVAQAGIGFLVMILLQWVVAKIVVNWGPFRKIVNPSPELVLWKGKMRCEVMQKKRVAEQDIRSALRGHGCDCVEQVDAVILEPDGTFSVIRHVGDNPTALRDLPDFDFPGPDACEGR